MQSQMIGMQSSLDRILSAIQANNAQNAHFHQQSQFPRPAEHPASYISSTQSSRGLEYYTSPITDAPRQDGSRDFPALPGFAPPVSYHAPMLKIGAN